MADLVIAPGDVAAVKVIEQMTGPVSEAVDSGEAVCLAAASGVFSLADEDNAALDEPVGVAIKNANQANIATTVVRKGWLDLGDALAGLAYGATVWLSDTAGKLADADPGSHVVIGTVIPAWGTTTADKLLRVDL